MSSVECLREFVNERLTAAAEEIFRVFTKTIVQYKEEINCQRRLLDICWKPEIKLHRIELPQQRICKEEEEEVRIDQQERNSSLDQEDLEPPQIKEEQEELCTSQEGKQLVLKQEETNTFMLTPSHEESDHSEPEANTDHQLLSNNSHLAESQDQKGDKHRDSESTRNTEPKPTRRHRKRSHSNNVYNPNLSEIHCNTHTGKKSFKCDTCGKDFMREAILQRHQSIHSGEKPYSCNTCGKRFSDLPKLKIHMRLHTGEKPYLCKTYGKRFTDISTLKRHMTIHTDEKPYLCKTCGKRFTNISGLKAHMTVHTGERPFTCKTCGKDFRFSSVLTVHMRIHTGERPYLCKTYRKKFNSSSALNRHMRFHT